MYKVFSFIFDIGNVLFTHQVFVDSHGDRKVVFTPIEEGIALLKECHAISARSGSLVLACTNLKKPEIVLLQELFPSTVALFKEIVSPDRALFKKPQAEMFQYLLTSYDLIPHHTLFFDDDIRNVEAARSVGIQGIHVEEGAKAREALKFYIPELGLKK